MTKIAKEEFFDFFVGIIISSAIAVYAASYMMQTFLTRVTINTLDNIILYDSEVGLWGTENVRVLKDLKKMIEKISISFKCKYAQN